MLSVSPWLSCAPYQMQKSCHRMAWLCWSCRCLPTCGREHHSWRNLGWTSHSLSSTTMACQHHTRCHVGNETVGKPHKLRLRNEGMLLLWLIMEQVYPVLIKAHTALFSDNSPIVSWMQWMAAWSSIMAMQLIWVFTCWLQQQCTSSP